MKSHTLTQMAQRFGYEKSVIAEAEYMVDMTKLKYPNCLERILFPTALFILQRLGKTHMNIDSRELCETFENNKRSIYANQTKMLQCCNIERAGHIL